MAGIKSVEFHIGAGKYEGDDDINWKYLDCFDAFVETKQNFDRYCTSYPISEFFVCIIFADGRQQRIDVDDGCRHTLVNGKWEHE